MNKNTVFKTTLIVAIPLAIMMMMMYNVGNVNTVYAQAAFPPSQQLPMNNPNMQPEFKNPFAEFWTDQETMAIQESLQNIGTFDRFIQTCGIAMEYNSTYGQPCSDTIKDIAMKFNTTYTENKDFINKVLRNN